MANEIIMRISASADNFGACSENCPGIWAAGDPVEACKADTLQAIELIKKNLPREDWPEPLKAGEYEIIWRYDTESFLYYYGTEVSDLAKAGWKPNGAHSPGQAKRHPGVSVLVQSRPERAKALNVLLKSSSGSNNND